MGLYNKVWGREVVDTLPVHFPCRAEEILLVLIFSSAVLILHTMSSLRNFQKNQQNRLKLEALTTKLRIKMD